MVDQELLTRNEYLAAENRILKAQLKGRLQLSNAERATLSEIGHRLGRKALAEVASVARPDTILAWYRKLIARKFDRSKARRSPGRPRISRAVEQLIVRMARENHDWGYDRIAGALANLGYAVCDQTVGNVLQRHGLPPAPERKRTATWPAFIRIHLALAQVMDFLPLHTFRRCVQRYPSNYPTKTFSHLDQFLCMAFAQLTFRDSLRDIEVCLRAHASKLYHAANRARERGVPMKPQLIECCERRYDAILAEGLAFHEAQVPLARAAMKGGGNWRGRAPRRTGHNLLLRLATRKQDTLRFLHDPTVPFTNNQAERDGRMMKLRQKISGGFRSPEGAMDFALIRSFFSTAKKQGFCNGPSVVNPSLALSDRRALASVRGRREAAT